MARHDVHSLSDDGHRARATRRLATYLILLLGLLLYTLPGHAAWLDVQVSADSDDGEERVSSGNMNLTSSDLEMVDEGGSSSNRQLVGMRFLNVVVANESHNGEPDAAAILHIKVDGKLAAMSMCAPAALREALVIGTPDTVIE